MGGTATYGAAKTYQDYLARALAFENKDKMDVLSYNCGMVNTKLNSN